MSDLNLTSFNPLYPMRIHPYKELLNDSNVNIMDKVNAIIDYLNQVGKLTNDVVKDWNTVYQWVMNDGLTTDVSNKIEEMKANGELQSLLNTIFNALTGDMTTLHTTAKDTIVNALNEVDDLAKSNQTQLAQNMQQNWADINRVLFYYKMSKAKKVTFVGDSVTEGTVNGLHGWFEPLQSKFPNATFINKGVGGNGTVDVINRLSDITSTGADLYVLAIGTNDVRYQNSAKGATTPAGYKTNIDTIVKAFKQAGGDVIIVELFPAFNNDSGSTLGYSLRDKTAKLYSASAKEYCGSNNIPYIEIFDDLKYALDLNNKSNFLIDYIHPNATIGLQLYADEVLYGKRYCENYGISKSRAGSSVTYVYKLEILSASGSNTSIDLKTLTADQSAVGTVWTTCNKSNQNDISQIFNTANTTYHFQNDTNDFPVIITFGTSAPIKRLKQDFFTSAIGKYKLFESTDGEAILKFDHPSWKQIAGTEWTGTADPLLSSAKKILYNAEQSVSLTLQPNWSYRNGKNRIITKGTDVIISVGFKKTTAWTAGETIATLPTDLVPLAAKLPIAVTLLDTGTDFQTGFVSINTDGTIQAPTRTTNPSAYDCIILECTYSIL